MDFRKIIEFGRCSFVVSLPKNWTRKNNLKKGDIVYLQEDDHSLVLSTREKTFIKEPKRISIRADGKPIEKLHAEIVAAYLSNYDIFEIKGFSIKDNSPEIKKIIQNFVGIELLEQDGSRIVARDLMDTKEISVQAITRRIDIIIRSMIKDSMSPLHEDFYESIFHRDVDINRLVFLVKRVIKSAFSDQNIARKLGRSNLELLKDWNIVSLLESIGDEIKRVAREFKVVKTKHLKELMKFNKELGEQYFALMKSYHTKNLDAAYKAELSHKKKVEQLEKFDKKSHDHVTSKLINHMKILDAHLKNMARAIIA
jgi:phosphate uptake regulator